MFRENCQYDNKDEFPDFYELTLYTVVFAISWKNRLKFQYSYIGYIREKPGNHPYYQFCDFPSEMANLGQKWKFWFFSGFRLI